jgi:rubrerythrin
VESLAGGIDAWQGLVATGGYTQGMDLLGGVRYAVDILPIALALEEGACLFYSAAGELLDDAEAGELFAALVEAEEGHKGRLVEACRVMMPDVQCEIPAGEEGLKGFMEGAVRIDEALEWARSRKEHPAEILDLAMQLEANSLDFYLKVAGRSEFIPVRETLDKLIADEKSHLKWLGSLLEKNA